MPGSRFVRRGGRLSPVYRAARSASAQGSFEDDLLGGDRISSQPGADNGDSAVGEPLALHGERFFLRLDADRRQGAGVRARSEVVSERPRTRDDALQPVFREGDETEAVGRGETEINTPLCGRGCDREEGNKEERREFSHV